MCTLRSWRASCVLVFAILVAGALTGCSAGPSTAVLLDPLPPASPSPGAALDDPDMGERLFTGRIAVPGSVACIGCHSVDPASRAGIGPNLAGIARTAGERIPGMTAAEYIERSIRFHDEYVVPGYSPGIARGTMGGKDFDQVLTDAQIAALVAYLMQLPAGASGAGGAAGGDLALSAPPSGASPAPSATPGAPPPPRLPAPPRGT
ncbi:MAG: cytochrome c, partial [Chloroflexaceae bacterium]